MGQVGRGLLTLLSPIEEVDVVFVEEASPPGHWVPLLRPFASMEGGRLKMGRQCPQIIFREKALESGDYKRYALDVVVDATGQDRDATAASRYLKAGAKKVLVTTSIEGDHRLLIPKVGDSGPKDSPILATGSCTSQCLGAGLKPLEDVLGVEWVTYETTHSAGANQRLVDGAHPDPRRARRSLNNIIPTSTAAQNTLPRLFPKLAGQIQGLCLRVPVTDVSVVVAHVGVSGPLDSVSVKDILLQWSEGSLQGVLACSEIQGVSEDFRRHSASAIVDLPLTTASPSGIRLVMWYDNLWGFLHRLVETLIQLRAEENG